MTLKAREPVAAAFELNRDDIAFAMIMGASRLRIDIYAPDGCAVNLQCRLLNFLSRTHQDQCRCDNETRNHHRESAVKRAGALADVADDFGTEISADTSIAINESNRRCSC